ncbi:MAG: histidine kinase [Clostridia bacterium]|nr:histidine kinase [Clostridia bacterium]
MGRLNAGVDLFCAVLTAILYAVTLTQKARSRATVYFRRMLLVSFVMTSLHTVALLFFADKGIVFNILEACSFASFFVLMGTFTKYVCIVCGADDTFYRGLTFVCYGLCTVGMIVWVVTCFFPFLYDVQAQAYVTHGAVYFLVQSVNILVIAADIFILIANRKALTKTELVVLALLPLLPLLSFLFALLFPGLQSLYLLIFVSFFINYLRVSSVLEQRLLDQEKKMETYRLRSTLERIKPHYIYNVLSSIYYLCDYDPAAAQRATGQFSSYLRLALENMEGKSVIPFEHELATVENYLSLETMRFGDRIRVHYDIASRQFMVPPFTLQPLVENSVKHGTELTDQNTDIFICTREDALGYTFSVRDTCGGYDTSAVEPGSGMKYISDILMLTVHGTLTVKSKQGEGTVSTVFIPK